MSLLARTQVVPFGGQVHLSDLSSPDYPEWITGTESVVSLPHSVAVATQDDRIGKVSIEVWNGRIGVPDPMLSDSIFDGAFVGSGNTVTGNTIGNELVPVPISAGRHRLRVYASPAGQPPQRVYFVFDE